MDLLSARSAPLDMPWPTPGRPDGFIRFERPEEWQAFIGGLSIDPFIPDIVAAKYLRAQRLYLCGWLSADIIKAGELAALVALELALTDRIGGHYAKSKRSFAVLLKHLVIHDKLTDDQIPMIVRCGGTAVGQLTGETIPTLAQRRNSLANGDPFDGAPVGGLLELVRDLINFAYRDYIADARS